MTKRPMKTLCWALSVTLLLGLPTIPTGATETSTPATDASSTETASTEAASTETTPYNDGTYYYATFNMPYADFYYGELNTVTLTETADLAATDPVSAYRESGIYDAVSSATTSKSKMFPTTYTADTATGVDILGIKSVNVAIPIALYQSIQDNMAASDTCQNKLYEYFRSFTFIDSAPAEYKILNGDGSFSEMRTSSTSGYDSMTIDSDASATITTSSSYGNYQLAVTNTNVTLASMLGVILVTTDGSRYGLTHLDNLWIKTGDISFAVEDFIERHGNSIDYKKHSSLPGKTISKIIYLVKDGSDIEVDTNLLVKPLLTSDEESTITINDLTRNTSGMTTTYTNGLETSKSYDGTVTSLTYKKAAVASSLYQLDKTAKTLHLDGTLMPGTYTVVFSDDTYEDVTKTFKISSALKSTDMQFQENKLIISGTDATLAEYIGAINSVSVNGTILSTSSTIGSVLFDSSGNINFSASVTSKSKTTTFFPSGSDADYTLSISADGYPSIDAVVGKSAKAPASTETPIVVTPVTPVTIPVTGVALTQTSASLTKGQTIALSAAVLPSNTTESTAIAYSSSDSSVVTVDNSGLVTAVNCGTAVISARTGSFTAGCTITVEHTYGSETLIKAATQTEDGAMGKICTTDGSTVITSVIPRISQVKLDKTIFTYSGKTQKPTLTVTDSTGAVIGSDSYTVTFPSKSKAIGSYQINITFSGKYSGTAVGTYSIATKKTSAKVGSAKTKSFVVKWSKVSSATGYEIMYSTDASFKTANTKTTKSLNKTISGLTKNTKYYVKVRTYATVKVSGVKTNVYSDWSAVKTIKTKK